MVAPYLAPSEPILSFLAPSEPKFLHSWHRSWLGTVQCLPPPAVKQRSRWPTIWRHLMMRVDLSSGRSSFFGTFPTRDVARQRDPFWCPKKPGEILAVSAIVVPEILPVQSAECHDKLDLWIITRFSKNVGSKHYTRVSRAASRMNGIRYKWGGHTCVMPYMLNLITGLCMLFM